MAEYHLKLPLTNEDIEKLHIGDIIYLSGEMFMGRDAVHERSLEFKKEGKDLPLDPKGRAIFHCGPVVKKNEDNTWDVFAAGPTTSSRMNLFEPEFIEAFDVKVVIGKGGMDNRTLDALKKFKAVYCAFTGGAGVIAASGMKNKKMKEVHWLDLGTPEAFWIFDADEFGPLTVAMDSHGQSLYNNVRAKAAENIKDIEKEYNLKLT